MVKTVAFPFTVFWNTRIFTICWKQNKAIHEVVYVFFYLINTYIFPCIPMNKNNKKKTI